MHNMFACNGNGDTNIVVDGRKIDIVQEVDYLGRRLCLDELHVTEVENRISKAWAKFMGWKNELCSKHYLKGAAGGI